MIYKSLYEWINQKSKDQDKGLRFNPTTVTGNIIIALSGLLLYLDKAFTFFNVTIPIPIHYQNLDFNQETFVWFVSQSITPILLIIGAWLNANKIIYIIPLYCYILQFYFVMFDYNIVDDNYLYAYTIGTSILLIALVKIFRVLSKRRVINLVKKQKEKLERDL